MTAVAIARSSLRTSLARYSRSWGLWLLLLVAPVGARFWIPGENDTTVVIAVNGSAPVMSSAMLGVALGIVTSTLLLPVAFIYLRSNATRRQAWQIEEVTAASRVAMALGRYSADVAVLGAVLSAMTVAGWFIAWLVTPLDTINLGHVTLGLWLIAAPALMGVAALRMLFDSLRPTRGPFGEVMFFVLWLAAIAIPAAGAERNVSFAGNMLDFAGFVRPLSYSLPEGQKGDFAIGAAPVQHGRVELDVMSGLRSEGYVASRVAWAGIAILIAALGGLLYSAHRPRPERRRTGLIARLLAPGAPAAADPGAPGARPSRAPLIGLLVAELRLIGNGRLWRLTAALVAAGGAFLDYRTIIGPAALLLLVFGLTAHAARTEQPGLRALTRTAVLPALARRIAFVAAGLFWSLAMALPAIGRGAAAATAEPLLLASATGMAAALAAMLLGAWTRSAFAPRLVLLIAWYAYLASA
ncbi:MAG TPA: hypothetical protein VN231_15335 [Allosphingosinicella sp.]|nr:hypothetical protein [Allosphingosinicella sp.]